VDEENVSDIKEEIRTSHIFLQVNMYNEDTFPQKKGTHLHSSKMGTDGPGSNAKHCGGRKKRGVGML